MPSFFACFFFTGIASHLKTATPAESLRGVESALDGTRERVFCHRIADVDPCFRGSLCIKRPIAWYFKGQGASGRKMSLAPMRDAMSAA